MVFDNVTWVLTIFLLFCVSVKTLQRTGLLHSSLFPWVKRRKKGCCHLPSEGPRFSPRKAASPLKSGQGERGEGMLSRDPTRTKQKNEFRRQWVDPDIENSQATVYLAGHEQDKDYSIVWERQLQWLHGVKKTEQPRSYTHTPLLERHQESNRSKSSNVQKEVFP